MLNPWLANYGEVRRWSMGHAGWLPVGTVRPDTAWHSIRMELDPRRRFAELYFDGLRIRRLYTARPKLGYWGTETAARLQAEIISLDPGPFGSAPMHTAEVRNWRWKWTA